MRTPLEIHCGGEGDDLLQARRLKKKDRSGHVVGVAWQPDRVKWLPTAFERGRAEEGEERGKRQQES